MRRRLAILTILILFIFSLGTMVIHVGDVLIALGEAQKLTKLENLAMAQ